MKNLLFSLLFFLSSLSAKSLILIIASDNLPVYKIQEDSWKRYMNSMPDDFECYFIKEDENLDCLGKIIGNDLWIKNKPTFIPGILEKTVFAFQFFESRLNEFDYVVRTNLSSFFYLPVLKKFLYKHPKENLYCGCVLDFFDRRPPFVSGAAIYLTPDLCRLIANNEFEIFKMKYFEADDVVIGKFLKNKKITPVFKEMFEIADSKQLKKFKKIYEKNKHESIFHVRTKSSYSNRESWEQMVTDYLYEVYYQKTNLRLKKES